MITVLRSNAGFTLLELLIVIAILGLLGVVGTVQLSGYLGRAKTETARLQIEQLSTALELFRIDVGRLPTAEEGVSVLLRASGLDGWRGPYVRKADAISDPWGRQFGYQRPGERGEYDLFTLGADGQLGGTGENLDVSNWSARK